MTSSLCPLWIHSYWFLKMFREVCGCHCKGSFSIFPWSSKWGLNRCPLCVHGVSGEIQKALVNLSDISILVFVYGMTQMKIFETPFPELLIDDIGLFWTLLEFEHLCCEAELNSELFLDVKWWRYIMPHTHNAPNFILKKHKWSS